jgi:hypothetical protein
MAHARRVITVEAVVLFGSLSAAWAGSGLDAKAADYFTVKWSQIAYTKTDTIQNASAVTQGTSGSLVLSCAITIRDPNLVLGTLQQGVVTQLTGRQGQGISVGPPLQQPWLPYERPQYRQRFAQPPKEPHWRVLLRSVLRLSSNQSVRPKLVWELQPSQMNLQLDANALDQAGGELRQVKGHFYALVAESLENVDVPFEPNDRWVRLTPTLEIQLSQASCTGSSFLWRIETRPAEYLPLKWGDPLPDRLVVARQIIGSDGKPQDRFLGSSPWLPLYVGGGGGMSGGGTDCQIKAFRFVIAVNPAHCRIPFEFQRVPLPDPNQPPPRHQANK